MRVGDGGDGAEVGQVAQQPQPADVEHQLSLRLAARNVNWIFRSTGRQAGRHGHSRESSSPLVTPFDADGAVALGALAALADRLLDEGAAGLVALGTTGEPATLSEASGPRSSTSAGSARGAARRCWSAPAAARRPGRVARGRRACRGRRRVVVVPPYMRPGEAGVVAHLRAVAAASPVPVVVYHVPYRTGQALDVAALLELAAIPNVAGMKLSDGAVSGDTVALLGDLPAGFAVLGGDDAVIAPLLALGAAGGILASAHVATGRFVAPAEAWRDGDVGRGPAPSARRLAALSAALFAEPNPAVIKAVLHAQGRIPTPDVRLPLLPASRAGDHRGAAGPRPCHGGRPDRVNATARASMHRHGTITHGCRRHACPTEPHTGRFDQLVTVARRGLPGR